MGNVFMKKCDDVFTISKKFMKDYKLKKDYDLLIVDFHGEITSEKNAIGYYFDGKASLVVGTHTHIPTNDARVLKNGTAYQTDVGMCGNYDSVIGMDKKSAIDRFFSKKTYLTVAEGEITICGVLIEVNDDTGKSINIKPIRIGGVLQPTNIF